MRLRKLIDIDTIIVHCSATYPHQDIGAKEIDDWHTKAPFNFNAIGYNFVNRRNGQIEAGRSLEFKPAHAGRFNQRSIGICMVGGLSETNDTTVAINNFNAAQFISLNRLVDSLCITFPQLKYICGHRDVSVDQDGDGVIEPWEWSKDCPCFDTFDWYMDSSASRVTGFQLSKLTPELF